MVEPRAITGGELFLLAKSKMVKLDEQQLNSYCPFQTTQGRSEKLFKAGYGAGLHIMGQVGERPLPCGTKSETLWLLRFNCHASMKSQLWRVSLGLTATEILHNPTSAYECPVGVGCSHGYLLGLFVYIMQTSSSWLEYKRSVEKKSYVQEKNLVCTGGIVFFLALMLRAQTFRPKSTSKKLKRGVPRKRPHSRPHSES